MLSRASVIIIAISTSLSLSSCFQLFDPGPASEIKIVFNPLKTKKAILFMKGGNATSGDSMQISIKDADENLNSVEVGNVFTTDDNHGKARLDSTAVHLSWQSNNKLIIEYNSKLRTFLQIKEINGVSIIYKVQ